MRCRLGDLAIIVRSGYPENLGALVEIVCPSQEIDRDWYVRSLGRELTGADENGIIGRAHEGNVLDEQLRPIRGEPERTVDEIRELTPQQLEGVACWPT